jgi:hypothetical protein
MKKERLTGTLTRHNRPLESYLAGLNFDEGTIQQTVPFGNRLERDARAWMARGGLAQERRLTLRDAEHVWRQVAGAGAR